MSEIKGGEPRVTQSYVISLQTKNKLVVIDGSIEKYETDNVLAMHWDRCNSVVLSWILNSISEELFSGQVFSQLAKTVWDELKETYDIIDGSITFNLYQSVNTVSQNGSPIFDYYHKLNALWKQFDALVKLPSCTCTVNVEFKKT
ncbi:uncharacterized protein [Rutidosis leptorrhynchoides]|uniref:uncharacterized protein n=1 Tax=Rutidosis leptorrhynchoides TaxID=125765 RepID=UPI003A99DA45